MLRVLTLEDNCELMRIGINDYAKVVDVNYSFKFEEFSIIALNFNFLKNFSLKENQK